MATNKKADDIAAAETARKTLVKEYTGEKQVERSLSPLYAPYLGKAIQVQINGITIVFPVDGVSYKIPESFADAIDEKRMAIDATLNKAKAMADITKNSESYAGEIRMF